MGTLDIVFGVLLLIAALFLIIAVLMQNGKSHGLSGAISGGAETFFGKQKGSTIEKKLSKLTTIVAIIFVVIVLLVYVLQDQTDYDKMYESYMDALTDTDDDAKETGKETGKGTEKETEKETGTESAE